MTVTDLKRLSSLRVFTNAEILKGQSLEKSSRVMKRSIMHIEGKNGTKLDLKKKLEKI